MTLLHFENLDSEEQIAVVEAHGTIVGTREDSLLTMFLYQLFNFYVEMAYNKKDKELWRIGPFDHPVLLRPYLDQIDIQNLYDKE